MTKPPQLVDNVPVTEEEINSLIDSLQKSNEKILDLHFAIMESITEHYRNRQIGDNYHKAIVSCKAQIKIQADAARMFRSDYPGQTLPAHTGYNQLVIILEKEKNTEKHST